MVATEDTTAEANDGSYAALDQAIGKANRMIEDMGFHWWSCYVCRDTGGQLMVRFSLGMGTTKNTCIASDAVLYFGEPVTRFADRLALAKFHSEECATKEHVQFAECPRGAIRLPWGESLGFAPEFFDELETRDASAAVAFP